MTRMPMISKVDAAGRVVIPAAFRSALRLSAGDKVVMRLDETGAIRMTSRGAALEAARTLYRRFAPEGDSLADELIDERREHARKVP